MAVLVSIPTGRFLEKRPHRSPWVFGSLLVHRIGYLLIGISPWIHLPDISNGLLVVLILIGISAPAHFFNVGWIPLLAEIIPERRRAAVFTARNIVNQATVSVLVFLFGLWLSNVTFPINYQAMYFVGFAASMVSQFYLTKLAVPHSPPPLETTPKIRSLKDQIQFMGKALREHPEFMAITRNTFLHGMGVWMAGPLYALYFVRQLEASDAWLGLNGTIGCIGTIAGYSLWRWMMNRLGEPVTLKRTVVLIGLYPVLVGLTPSLPVILIFGAINGLIVPGLNLSHFNILLKVTPPEARPTYTSIYQNIMNVGAFVAPIVSVALADVFGFGPMLVVSGILSVIGSTSFWWWPVISEEHKPQPAA